MNPQQGMAQATHGEASPRPASPWPRQSLLNVWADDLSMDDLLERMLGHRRRRVHRQPRSPVPPAVQPGVPAGVPLGRHHHRRQPLRPARAAPAGPAGRQSPAWLRHRAGVLRARRHQHRRPHLPARRAPRRGADRSRGDERQGRPRAGGRRARSVDELRQRPGRDRVRAGHHPGQRRQCVAGGPRPRPSRRSGFPASAIFCRKFG